VPPELDAIVLKALQRDRDKRYQTAQEMARDLDQFLAAQAFPSEDAVAFVQELTALIASRQPPEIPSFDQLVTSEERPPRTIETAETAPGKETRGNFGERVRRFLLGRSRE
jgi:serine/threonine-protein kinase